MGVKMGYNFSAWNAVGEPGSNGNMNANGSIRSQTGGTPTTAIRVRKIDVQGYNLNTLLSQLPSWGTDGTHVGYLRISEGGSSDNIFSWSLYRVISIVENTNSYTFNVTPIDNTHELWALNDRVTLDFIPGNGIVSIVGPSSGVTLWGTNGFRLSLTNNVPDDPSDRVAQSTLYWTPYTSNAIALRSGGGAWVIRNISQRSLALSGLTANKNYDVFVYDNAGTPTLELGPAWTDDTTRATNIVRVDGVFVKQGDSSRRYVGSIRTTGTNTTESSQKVRYVYNHDNPLPTQISHYTNIDHSYSSTTPRLWGNSDPASTSRILVGVGNQRKLDGAGGSYGYSGSGGDARVSVSFDTNPATLSVLKEATMVQSTSPTWVWSDPPTNLAAQGLNYLRIVERSFGGSNLYGWVFSDFTFPM